MTDGNSFSDILLKLQNFWKNQGCLIVQPYDIPAGAGTFHPATLLKSLDSKPWSAAYVAPSRRPTDGRYGENPNRLGSYYQFQVLIKPSPDNIQELYLKSLQTLGLNRQEHDIRFVEDNWESPTLGAWGLGWEVWLDGMEVTQFTYFQQVGSIPCDPVPVEITYGVERLAMYIQGVDSIFDIQWVQKPDGESVLYADVHAEGEYEFSKYHFEIADTQMLFDMFEKTQNEAKRCLEAALPLPAYDYTMLSSHFFNVLDARKAISVAQRQNYILKIREIAKGCATLYKDQEAERESRTQAKRP
ncbi:glycine--tRNA ligase subunit alpha [Helicobacter sp. 12S02634-8]|uniref:glycine--tRNA ligase subunit alpha n=1 Tax=Helicobacter sp. 12S02634-8 TaxID=1476199 RepID=UPI000BA764FD|nr:glycine--tRNA ligase subunit alpha [Helicobacter sp. 12S02634-8]PAF46543.1 glycine--tRNA ligase subunit alpha [Helicobacter sp. 12S02634-8]